MNRVAPAGDVYQAGTLSGNPLATAAGLATLELLDAAAYHRLTVVAEALASGLRDAAAATGVPVEVAATTGLLTVFFHDGPVSRLRRREGVRHRAPTQPSAARCSIAACILPPSQFEAWFPSLAHSDEHVEHTLVAAREAFAEVAR